LPNGFVNFDGLTLGESRQRSMISNLAQGPGAGAPNDRLGVVQAVYQGRYGRTGALIAEHDGRVAEDAAAAGPP
jgi:hypothetical protein